MNKSTFLKSVCLAMGLFGASVQALARPPAQCFNNAAAKLYFDAFSEISGQGGLPAPLLGKVETLFASQSKDGFNASLFVMTSDRKPVLHDVAFSISTIGNTYVCTAYCYLKPNQLQDFACLYQ